MSTEPAGVQPGWLTAYRAEITPIPGPVMDGVVFLSHGRPHRFWATDQPAQAARELVNVERRALASVSRVVWED